MSQPTWQEADQLLAFSPQLQGSSLNPLHIQVFPLLQVFKSSAPPFRTTAVQGRAFRKPIHKWLHSLLALRSSCMDANTSGLVRRVCANAHPAQGLTGGRANWPVNVILTIGRQVVIDNQGHLLHINATSLQRNTKSLMQVRDYFPIYPSQAFVNHIISYELQLCSP